MSVSGIEKAGMIGMLAECWAEPWQVVIHGTLTKFPSFPIREEGRHRHTGIIWDHCLVTSANCKFDYVDSS